MVAIIKTGNSIRQTFHYNENKLKEGIAECIMAANYPDEAINLSEKQRLNMLLKLAALNENVTRNAVHISLNFDPSEQLSQSDLKEISQSYMDKIGFGNQPFLVYQHHDSGHPHIHIVSVKVAADGRRIETQNIGKNQSEKARKQIEIDFNLVKANERKRDSFVIKPAMVKANYGKTETKRAISNVLSGVIDQYKFTSIPELNAVLNQFNVAADRGSEDSRTYKKGGLNYRLINERGERVGVPIKASDFAQKPTLKNLLERFEANEQKRQPDKNRFKNTIDFALLGKANTTLEKLTNQLRREGIETVIRQNDAGQIYGITYVDHRTRSVFNGSSLGKSYSAKAIQERCAPHENRPAYEHLNRQKLSADPANANRNEALGGFHGGDLRSSSSEIGAADALFDPAKQDGSTPSQLRSKRRKKKKGLSQQL